MLTAPHQPPAASQRSTWSRRSAPQKASPSTKHERRAEDAALDRRLRRLLQALLDRRVGHRREQSGALDAERLGDIGDVLRASDVPPLAPMGVQDGLRQRLGLVRIVLPEPDAGAARRERVRRHDRRRFEGHVQKPGEARQVAHHVVALQGRVHERLRARQLEGRAQHDRVPATSRPCRAAIASIRVLAR